jgi:hypothetical protein
MWGPRPKGVMHLLFDIFVLPPLVIAGVVLIATWNLRDAIIAFRIGFFACPICGLFILADRGPEGNWAAVYCGRVRDLLVEGHAPAVCSGLLSASEPTIVSW